MCRAQLYLLHWLRPAYSPSPHLGSYARTLLVSQDRRHLFVTPSIQLLYKKMFEDDFSVYAPSWQFRTWLVVCTWEHAHRFKPKRRHGYPTVTTIWMPRMIWVMTAVCIRKLFTRWKRRYVARSWAAPTRAARTGGPFKLPSQYISRPPLSPPTTAISGPILYCLRPLWFRPEQYI